MNNFDLGINPFYLTVKQKIKSLENTLISRDFLSICVVEENFTKNTLEYYSVFNPFSDYCTKKNKTFEVGQYDFDLIQEIIEMYNQFASNEEYYSFNKSYAITESDKFSFDEWVVNHVENVCDKIDSLIDSYVEKESNIEKLLKSNDSQKIILSNLAIYISLVSFYKEAVHHVLSSIFEEEEDPYVILNSNSRIKEFVSNLDGIEKYFLINSSDYEKLKQDIAEEENYFKRQTQEFNRKILLGEYDKQIISELVYMVSRVLNTENDNSKLIASADNLFKTYIRKCYSIFYNFCTSENENFMSYLLMDDEFVRMQLVGVNLKNIIMDCSGAFLRMLYKVVFGFLEEEFTYDFHYREYLSNLADLFKLLGDGITLKKRHRIASATLKATMRDSLILGAKLVAYSTLEGLIYSFPIPLTLSKESKTTNLKELYEALFILKTIYDRTGGSQDPSQFIKGYKDKLNSIKDTNEYKEMLSKGGGIVSRSPSITSIVAQKTLSSFEFSYVIFNLEVLEMFTNNLGTNASSDVVKNYLDGLDDNLPDYDSVTKFNLFEKDIECFFLLQYLNLKTTMADKGPVYLDIELITETFESLTFLEKKLLNYAYETQLKAEETFVVNMNNVYYNYPEVFVLKAYDYLTKNNNTIISDEEILRKDEDGNNIYNDETIALNDNLKFFVENYVDSDLVTKQIEWEEKLSDYYRYIPTTLKFMERYCAAHYNAKTLLNYLVQYLPTTFLLTNSFDWLKDAIDYAFDGIENLFKTAKFYEDDITSMLEIKTNFLAIETKKNYSLSKKWLKMEAEVRSFIKKLDNLNEKFFYELDSIRELYKSNYFNI